MSRKDEKALRLDKRAQALRDNMRKRKEKSKELKNVPIERKDDPSKS